VQTLLTVDAARTFPGLPESARAARVWVVSLLPADSPATDDVALMVSELVTYALRYSRSGLPGGSVYASLAISGGQVRVDVVDQGAVPELAEPVYLIDAGSGDVHQLGVGLAIICELADTFGAAGPHRWFTLGLDAVVMPGRTSPSAGHDHGNPCPAGPSAAAMRFLRAAAIRNGDRSLAERKLAARIGIGWALLAHGDQLADVSDVGTDISARLAELARLLGDLHRPPLTVRIRKALSRLRLDVLWSADRS
jgi:serine/threonine-protein kinase RsbW